MTQAIETSYDRPIELDLPLAPTSAPQAAAPVDPGALPLLQRMDAAPTAGALEAVVAEILAGPVGGMPKSHPVRTALRTAYQGRLAVLVALWWTAWIRLWERMGEAYDTSQADAIKLRQSIPTAGLAAVADAIPAPAAVTGDPLASALVDIAAETAAASAARTARASVRASVGAAVNGETRGQIREAIRRDGLVTVAADALGGVVSGVGLAWDGLGEMTHGQIRDALAAAQLPAEWAPPIPSSRAILGLVMAGENRSGNVARPERGVSSRHRTISTAGAPSRYSVRWSVLTPSHGEVGDHAGSIAATVALLADDTLHCEGHPTICARVREEFSRRIAETVMEAGQVTAWLQEVFRVRLGAIRYLGYYIPARHAAEATRLVAAMARTGWGSWPANPPQPMITCEALAVGLTRGLESEITALLCDLDNKRAKAKAEISAAVAATLLVAVRDLVERTSRVRDVIGGEHVTKLRARLVAAAETLEPIASDMADGISVIRFANLELS